MRVLDSCWGTLPYAAVLYTRTYGDNDDDHYDNYDDN